MTAATRLARQDAAIVSREGVDATYTHVGSGQEDSVLVVINERSGLIDGGGLGPFELRPSALVLQGDIGTWEQGDKFQIGTDRYTVDDGTLYNGAYTLALIKEP